MDLNAPPPAPPGEDKRDIRMKIHDPNNREGLLTFVTVCFSGEFANLLLQARSLSMYGQRAIKDWIIAFNDEIDAESRDKLFLSLQRELKGVGFNVLWIDRKDMTDIDLSKMEGSRSQQILKICISNFVEDKFYVMLDAKNHAVRKLETEFFVRNDMPVVHWQEYEHWNPFYRWFRKAFTLFGLSEDKEAFEKYQSTTPYVMETETARKCMDSSLILSENPWHYFVGLMGDEAESITEFALYGAVSALLKRETIIADKQYVTLFNGWPRGEGEIIRSILEIENNNIKFFGVHRDRGWALNAEEKSLLATQWLNRGLFSSVENGVSFLQNGLLEDYLLPP